MTQRVLQVFAMSAMLGISLFACLESRKPTKEAWEAGLALRKASDFGFGNRGARLDRVRGPKICEDEVRFFTILRSPSPHRVYRDVYDHGNNVARAWAVAGLLASEHGDDSRVVEFKAREDRGSQVFWVTGNTFWLPTFDELYLHFTSERHQQYIRENR